MEATSGETAPMLGAVVCETRTAPATCGGSTARAAFTGQSRKTATLLRVGEQGYASANGTLECEPFANTDYVTREARSLLGLPSGEGPAQHHPQCGRPASQ